MFQINTSVFSIIAYLIYITIFLGIAFSFLKFRHNLSGIKIMLSGIGLIILGFGFLTVSDFKFMFPLLNFIILSLGAIIIFIGLCYKD